MKNNKTINNEKKKKKNRSVQPQHAHGHTKDEQHQKHSLETYFGLAWSGLVRLEAMNMCLNLSRQGQTRLEIWICHHNRYQSSISSPWFVVHNKEM